jgi:DNA-directed RNA polymerase specialized sigma24 family protein
VTLQLEAERFAKAPGGEGELKPIEDALADPASTFAYREHIAFCFACAARTLPPEEQVALMLVDVFGFTYREAARMSEVSEAVLRHRLHDVIFRLVTRMVEEGISRSSPG